MNSINLVGRLTADIEPKMSDSEKKYCHFTVAVRRSKERADFIDCTAFDATVDFLSKHTKRGSMIGVSGSLSTGIYEDSDGVRRKSASVLVDNVTLVEFSNSEK